MADTYNADLASAEVATRLFRRGYRDVTPNMIWIGLRNGDIDYRMYWPAEYGPVPEGLQEALSREVKRVLLGLPDDSTPPIGTGEVARLDPFPEVVEHLKHVPPLRDKDAEDTTDRSAPPPGEEERDRMVIHYAKGFHTYYGSPFVAEIDGRWLMCVEEEAGVGSWRRVSADFAQAWIREFGGQQEK